jgi:hypothetical protein
VSRPDKLLLLAHECDRLRLASGHLQVSVGRTQDLIPRLHEPLAPDELERLESLASRFARLADLLIQRVMRLVDELELVPGGSLLDRIHRAEKRGWSAQAGMLTRIRELRNLIAHEYAAERMVEIYQAVAELSPALIDSAERAQTHARALAERLQEHTR